VAGAADPARPTRSTSPARCCCCCRGHRGSARGVDICFPRRCPRRGPCPATGTGDAGPRAGNAGCHRPAGPRCGSPSRCRPPATGATNRPRPAAAAPPPCARRGGRRGLWRRRRRHRRPLLFRPPPRRCSARASGLGPGPGRGSGYGTRGRRCGRGDGPGVPSRATGSRTRSANGLASDGRVPGSLWTWAGLAPSTTEGHRGRGLLTVTATAWGSRLYYWAINMDNKHE